MNSNIFLILFPLLTLSLPALAATSAACPGESGYWFTNYKHRNPTQGGFISDEADVQDTDDLIFIGPKVSVCGSSRVIDQARIYGNAVIRNGRISGHAEISGNAVIENGAEVSDEAKIQGDAVLRGSVKISGKAVIAESALLENRDIENLAEVGGSAYVGGNAFITENATVSGKSRVTGNARLRGTVRVDGSAQLKGFTVRNKGHIDSGIIDEPDYEEIERRRLQEIEDERLRKIQESDEIKKAEDDRKRQENAKRQDLAKKQELRKQIETDILNIAIQVQLKMQFAKNNCAIRITDQNGKIFNFDFTEKTSSLARISGKSGITIERSGTEFTLLMESEVENGEWFYLPFFNVNDRTFAEGFKLKLESYFSGCH